MIKAVPRILAIDKNVKIVIVGNEEESAMAKPMKAKAGRRGS